MRYSTGPKKRSRLQGHRKRRRIIAIVDHPPKEKLSLTEYKTIRQYHSMGDMLDEFRVYGFGAGVESLIQKDASVSSGNGHGWLTGDNKQ